MGTGYHGGFGYTAGAVAGDTQFPTNPSLFFENIARRNDVDRDGVFDVVAHGNKYTIKIAHHDKDIEIDSRITAKLIRLNPNYKPGQPIRLLSCNTGFSPKGFAQNLANKLNVIVFAPTKEVWAYANGHYIVAGRKKDNYNEPDLKNRGSFIPFYPGGNKK